MLGCGSTSRPTTASSMLRHSRPTSCRLVDCAFSSISAKNMRAYVICGGTHESRQCPSVVHLHRMDGHSRSCRRCLCHSTQRFSSATLSGRGWPFRSTFDAASPMARCRSRLELLTNQRACPGCRSATPTRWVRRASATISGFSSIGMWPTPERVTSST
jgi:hypothetical protein